MDLLMALGLMLIFLPERVAVDVQGTVYVADEGNNRIRKITPNGEVTTLAGNGTPGFSDGSGPEVMFNFPSGVAVDVEGNVYVAEVGNSVIRKIRPNGEVTTLAGSTPGFADGSGANARFSFPSGVAVYTQ